MEFNIKYVNKSPVVWSDNFFTKEEINIIQAECSRIRKLGLLNKDNTASANKEIKNAKTGEVKTKELKKNTAIFLEHLYQGDHRLSDTLTICHNKVSDSSFIDYISGIHPYFITLQNKKYAALLSYYDNADKYEGHRDQAYVTVLTWFYEDPKQFKGGDFIIENDFKIECKRGRTVFMPSYLLHEVTPISMLKKNINKGLGRYTISQFIGY